MTRLIHSKHSKMVKETAYKMTVEWTSFRPPPFVWTNGVTERVRHIDVKLKVLT